MIDPNNVPVVADHEQLARYILQSSHIRRSNLTIKPDAFVPHPYLELSVTRHRDASESEIWSWGENVAGETGKTLYGCGNIQAMVCISNSLTVLANPLSGNPNHANIVGWPSDKPRQKLIAAEIAAAAMFVDRPKSQRTS